MKRLNLLFVILCLSVLWMAFPKDSLATTTSARNYFVSPQGRDSNSGTILKPWKTIQKAANCVKPGDTVYIREGKYNERVILKKSGTFDKYITFTNYSGETVTIDGTGLSWGYDWDSLFEINSKSFINVIGLKIINSNWFGIGSSPDVLGSQNVIIQNCSTYNTKASGIAFYHAANITVDGNSVEKACIGTIGTQECISLDDVMTFKISNNHVFNITNAIPGAGGEGIDAKNGCSNGVICNNVVNDVYKSGIYVDAFSKYENDIKVYGNKIYNTCTGIAVATEDNGYLENVVIYNNLIYNCVNWGFVVGGWGIGNSINGISFVNNTIYNCGDGAIYLNNSNATDILIANNILIGDTRSASFPIYCDYENLAETIIDHNLLNRIVDGQPTGTNYIVGDPNFVSPDSADFHIQALSPAINQGIAELAPSTDLDNQARESSVDIGCYNYN